MTFKCQRPITKCLIGIVGKYRYVWGQLLRKHITTEILLRESRCSAEEMATFFTILVVSCEIKCSALFQISIMKNLSYRSVCFNSSQGVRQWRLLCFAWSQSLLETRLWVLYQPLFSKLLSSFRCFNDSLGTKGGGVCAWLFPYLLLYISFSIFHYYLKADAPTTSTFVKMKQHNISKYFWNTVFFIFH